MPEKKANSRRQFLKALALLLASDTADQFNLSQSSFAKASTANYKLAEWTGDDFTLGHRMRDGNIPAFPNSAESTVDFIIVGGGMAGLAAAYYLRDHNFLLLEQYDELGGQSRGRSYRGIDYSLGAACTGSVDGIFGKLFDDLNIKPAKIPPTKNSWYWDKQWLPGVSGQDQALIYKEFNRLFAECQPIWKILASGKDQIDLNNQDISRLDSTLFSAYLQGYDSKFISLIDRFCLACLCGGINSVSALAGISMCKDLVSPSYVFPGGNPAIAQALARKLEGSGSGRCLTSTFVWNIAIKDGYAEVVYSTRQGTMHKVKCRRAIVTTPPLVAGRIIPDLDDAAKAIMLWPKYGSYLVANFLMPKKVFNGSYANWTGSPFTFTDVVIAETPYEVLGTYKPAMGSVLTVYQPYPPSSPGRGILIEGNREELAESLVEQFSSLVEQFQNNLEEVVLTRWGHAMVVPKPTFFSKLARLNTLDLNPIILAHNSTQGLPSAESAITAAFKASLRAKN